MLNSLKKNQPHQTTTFTVNPLIINILGINNFKFKVIVNIISRFLTFTLYSLIQGL